MASTPQDRVAAYRDQYGDVPWAWDGTDASRARDAALGVTVQNALECIDLDRVEEARAWIDLGQLASFRWRRSARS
jgi:hypothetical protein